ncbi:YcgL domain-containing protein, partial [Escherichia coli]
MFCVIYRSTKREQTYLYVEKKDDFSRVPDELMRSFGTPQMAMLLPLDGRKNIWDSPLC